MVLYDDRIEGVLNDYKNLIEKRYIEDWILSEFNQDFTKFTDKNVTSLLKFLFQVLIPPFWSKIWLKSQKKFFVRKIIQNQQKQMFNRFYRWRHYLRISSASKFY